jgi:hypothetical protein
MENIKLFNTEHEFFQDFLDAASRGFLGRFRRVEPLAGFFVSVSLSLSLAGLGNIPRIRKVSTRVQAASPLEGNQTILVWREEIRDAVRSTTERSGISKPPHPIRRHPKAFRDF